MPNAFISTRIPQTYFLIFSPGVRTDVYWQDSTQARAGTELLFTSARHGGAHEEKKYLDRPED